MKVAYNNCFGGFSLSPTAEHEYRKKKGINLTWYEELEGGGYKRINDISTLSEFKGIFLISSNADLGEKVKKIPDDNFFYESFYGDKNRSDPDLIEVIERLGEKANGHCAKLAIEEIPDGAEFEITEYDGNEDVVPPRMSW
jgi:hypothetical protein